MMDCRYEAQEEVSNGGYSRPVASSPIPNQSVINPLMIDWSIEEENEEMERSPYTSPLSPSIYSPTPDHAMLAANDGEVIDGFSEYSLN